MKTSITIEEWLAELEKLQGPRDEGLSVEELSEKVGKSAQQIRKLIRVARREGRLVTGHQLAPRIDGILSPVPVYRIKPKPSAKK